MNIKPLLTLGIFLCPTLTNATECGYRNGSTIDCDNATSYVTYGSVLHCTSAGPREACMTFMAGSIKVAFKVTNCLSCPSVRTRTAISLPCTIPSSMGDTLYDCVCNNGCVDDSSWTSDTEYIYKNICATTTCVKTKSYLCNKGYYGLSSGMQNTTRSGCTKCPTWSDGYTTINLTTNVSGTSGFAAHSITGCFIPTGTYYDATGTFEISEQCDYSTQ